MRRPQRRNILIIKLGALGDFIQALGPMAAIRKHHPDSNIVLLTTKPFEALARASHYVDEIWIDERAKWFQAGLWIMLAKRFNAGRFGRVYDLQNNDRTSFYLRLFFPRPEWVGVAPGASHRNTSSTRTAGQAFDGHVETLALAGVEEVSVDRLEWLKGQNIFEDLKSPYVLIVPGSSPGHPEKRWPKELYAELCREFIAKSIQPVVIGTSAEADITSFIQTAAPGTLNLTGKTTLFDLPTLARNALGAIGNDTGPMHLIAPTGCKCLVLFSGKSQPRRHAPKGDHVLTLQKTNIGDLTLHEILWKFST